MEVSIARKIIKREIKEECKTSLKKNQSNLNKERRKKSAKTITMEEATKIDNTIVMIEATIETAEVTITIKNTQKKEEKTRERPG